MRRQAAVLQARTRDIEHKVESGDTSVFVVVPIWEGLGHRRDTLAVAPPRGEHELRVSQ